MNTPEIVRFGELVPCRTAFIDAHTPGSDRKENFTIIGAGVTESPDQHVHIKATPGFNIGAAGQPPRCFNSLHYHNTAEVFFVLKGRWRFFWGRNGDAGEVILEEGDIFNIPTRVFRGFENVGEDYGMIMSMLGGDDAGGGVIWAPQVLEAAKAHGLVLAETGVLYDTKKGGSLPSGVNPMPVLTEAELAQIPEVPTDQIVPRYVGRYWDMMALAKSKPCRVIGEDALIKDRPGFSVELLSSGYGSALEASQRDQVLMVMRGHWRLTWGTHSEILNPGDTCWLPPGIEYQLDVTLSTEASLFRVTRTDDSAGLTWSEEP